MIILQLHTIVMIIYHSLDHLLFEFSSQLFSRNKIKKPSNGLPRRAVRRFYQGIFCFQNFKSFDFILVNVLSFIP